MGEADLRCWHGDDARPSSSADGTPFVVSAWRTLYLAGEIDLATGPLLAAALEPFVERGGLVDVDLSDVSFIDPAGITVLLRAADALGGRGTLLVHHPKPNVRRVIALTGLGDVVDVRPPTNRTSTRTARRLRAV